MNIQSIPVSSLVALDTPQKKLFDSSIKDIINTIKEPSESQRQQILEQQAQTKAHTVYRAGNNIIGVLWADGSAGFGSNSSVASEAINNAYNSNELQNLKGEALTEKLAQIIDKAFSKYGSGVDAQTYAPNDAPNRGYLSHQIDWMQDYPLSTKRLGTIYA
ncbi:MAG: hypothetical protein WC279_07635 [Sulfurimonas sp.]|jgi:translation elongation factor EF-Ts|uniref:hypothetical protein n=1 Tax=unclassified Sulfurimonas TaxID=2623549 RepID=UPI0008BB9F05|nr:hypothetical protein [Sulfurimonas sp. RIFOXYB12_FULL_35_9]MBS4069661.1 hypothetical protein [Sulfurimonas sp.]OHE03616.1 MAG: hypothetical protein A2345_11045 [Sulfurimonas sp. RIFOXYB12_FULL_35_9]